MSVSFISILSTIIIFQLAFLSSFLLFSTRGKKISNRILAFFFIWLILNIVDGLLSLSGFYENFPALAHLEDGFIFLVGPLLYFYTLSIVYKDFEFRKTDVIHIVPFAVLLTCYQLYYHFQTEAFQKQIQFSIANQDLPAGVYIAIAVIYLHIGFYLMFSFRCLNIYHKKIKDQFSSTEKIRLNWLTFMLSFISFLLVISLIYTFLPTTGFQKFSPFFFGLSFITISVFTTSVVWKGMQQPGIFSGIEYPSLTNNEKYAGSGLHDTEKKAIKERLLLLFEKEKTFLQADLTIEHLAGGVNTSSKKLSQVINETFGQTFFDFVNTYRIEEAKKILFESGDVKLTVLEVMYQCGFNSKSSFNTIFRKKTGFTPGEFRRQAILKISADKSV